MNEEVETLARAQFTTLESENNLNPLNLAFPPKNGTYTDPRTLQKRVDEVSKRCEAKGVNVHSLRHSCASILIAAHTPLIQVQHWLGHRTMLTTADLYSRLDSSLINECGEGMKKFRCQ